MANESIEDLGLIDTCQKAKRAKLIFLSQMIQKKDQRSQYSLKDTLEIQK